MRINERVTRHNHVHRDAALVTCDIKHCGTHAWTQGVIPLAQQLEKPDPLVDEAQALWESLAKEQVDLLALWDLSRTSFEKHTGQCHDDLLPVCARIRDKIKRAVAINAELAAKYPALVEGNIAYNFQLAKNVSENLIKLVDACHTH